MTIKLVTFCEHCNEITEQLGIDDGGTEWCLYCVHANGDIDDDALKFIEKAVKALKKKVKK